MKALFIALCSLAVLAPANSSVAQTPGASGQLAAFNAFIDNPKPPDALTPALTLDEIERIALAENPEIHVASRKVSMAEAHVPTTGKLDDPQFMVRNWQVPLNKPWDYNAAQNMLMLSQSLPGPGKRALQTTIAKSDVTEAKDEFGVWCGCGFVSRFARPSSIFCWRRRSCAFTTSMWTLRARPLKQRASSTRWARFRNRMC